MNTQPNNLTEAQKAAILKAASLSQESKLAVLKLIAELKKKSVR